jgi:hypothetical protein
MTRKLILLAGALMLLVTAWTSKAEAIGNCSCTFCRVAQANCTVGGEMWWCPDYYLVFC